MIYIICWKEFKNRKMENRAEIIKEDSSEIALNKMIQYNAEQRKTTTDYAIFDLTTLFKDKGFKIQT